VTARQGWFVAVAAFLLVGVLFLGVRPMQVPDEARYGIIPAAMVESGDWLSLRLAGFRFYEKPPLVYWLTAASISVFGEQPFAIRLPSALATLVTALCAAWLAVRITGRRELGPLAFLVQATTVMPMVLGGVITLDPTFAATVALTMSAFLGACTSSGRARAGWLAAAGAAAGFAFLAKGLLAFAIPGATALAWLAWQRRWRDMLTMPWIPGLAAAAAAAPFVLAVERANPGMWEYFVMKEHVRRAVSPDLTQQPQPWWFYGAVFPAGALLWTLAWPNAAKGLRGAAEWREGTRFLLCWAIVPILALSLSGGKLATYLLPMFAPVSVLVAMGLVRGRELGSVVRDVPARIGQTLVWIAAAGCLALAIAGPERFGMPTLWESGAAARLGCLAAALVAWALADGWSWRAAEGTRWLARTALAPVAVLAMVPFLYPTAALKAAKHPWPFLERHREALRAVDVLVVAGGSPALATSWTTGRRDLVIAGWADEFDNELKLPEEMPRRIGWEEVAARVIEARTANPPRTLAVLCDTPAVDQVLGSGGLPAPAVQHADRDLTVLFWR
jgi:4-amino-4-deoxy-L-arabinose transferase